MAFWYAYLSPECTGTERGVGDTQQETNLGVGLLKIVAGKKEFIGRSYENCHFQCRNSAVHLLLRRQWHSNSTWNWFHVFSYERLFSFSYWRGILSTPIFFQSVYWKFNESLLDEKDFQDQIELMLKQELTSDIIGNSWLAKLKDRIRSFATDYNRKLKLDRILDR